ncbi:MAG: hypothetical protein AB7E66_14075 [Parvibaculaceae bacterium]
MEGSGHRLALGFAAAVLVVSLIAGMAAMRSAALPPEAAGKMLAVFEPGTNEDAMFTAIVKAGAAPVRRTWLPFVWVVAGEEPGLAGRLVSAGAIGSYGELPFSPQIAGCFAFADAKAMELFSLRP